MTILNISKSVNKLNRLTVKTYSLGMKHIKLIIILFFSTAILIGLGFTGRSYACASYQQACSTNYGVSRTDFSSGSTLDTTCSTSYCADQTLGDTTVGLTTGTNYKAQTGYNVDRVPSLEFMVNTANINAGVLSVGSTATATASFSVESYLSSGYVVDTISPPPTYGSHTLSAPSTPTASAPGSEQFGINLVANTTACGAPTNFGANPVQVPSSSFSYGTVTANYDTCGKFMYINGDTIAESAQSSGQTDYTISYIFNIDTTTPAGVYTMEQQLVATPTF
jgi:hypothetical protein